jgi:hypothetical protein
MNNQSIRATWKLIEDYPTKDGFYLVAFENSSGDFELIDCEVWEFSAGSWYSVDGEEDSFPMFYTDIPMPRLG